MIKNAKTTDRRQVELSVIGAMLLSVEAAEYAGDELKPEAFSCIDLRTQFRAVVNMMAAGTPFESDPVTLADFLARRGELGAAGGFDGISDSLSAVPHSAHIQHYVGQLRELHHRDCLRQLSERLKRDAENPTCEPTETIDAILNELELIRAGNVDQRDLKTAADALEEADRRSADDSKIVPTGLPELDRQLRGGVRPGQLIVWGGRPGTGKSAAMYQIIQNAGKSGQPGMIASLEMTAGEIAERGLRTIDRESFGKLPILFAECSDFNKLISVVRIAKRRNSIEILCVDYLQLIETPAGRNENRERQVASVSRSLKRVAMELQIPILLGSQLNRDSEKRGRPSLVDLRESGAIEQDADIVILIDGDASADKRELIVAKHRGGPCGIVKAVFDRPRFQFSAEASR